MIKNLSIYLIMAQFVVSSVIATFPDKIKVKEAPLQPHQVLPSTKNYSDVKFINPYVRAASKGHNTAAFVEVRNLSDQNLQIVNAYCSIAKITELHISVKENNIHKMRPISFITIDKDETIKLQPGGLHIMLINLKKDLHIGQSIDMFITFNNGQRIPISFIVKKIHSCHS